jgi:hypothetical protein
MDGTATINLYELKIPTQADQDNTSYITRYEFETVINQLKELYGIRQNNPVVNEEIIKEDSFPAAPPKPQQFMF